MMLLCASACAPSWPFAFVIPWEVLLRAANASMWLQPATPPQRPPRNSTILDDHHEEDAEADGISSIDGEECRRRSPWRLSNEQPLPASPSPLSPYTQRVEPAADKPARGRVRSIAGELDAQRSKPSALGRLRLAAVVASLQPESAAMVKEVEEATARERQLQEQQERARTEAAAWQVVTSQSSEARRDELAGLAAARAQSGGADEPPRNGPALDSQAEDAAAEQALRRKAEAARKRKSEAAEEAAKWEEEERECQRREAQAAAERDVRRGAELDESPPAADVPVTSNVEEQSWWYSLGPEAFCAGRGGGGGGGNSFGMWFWICTQRPGKREAGCPRPM